MSENKNNNPQMNYVQEPLIKSLKDVSDSTLTAFEIDDEVRDLLFETILALLSVKGIGVKTLSPLFDNNFLRHIWEWDLATLISQWNPSANKQKADLIENFFQKKQQFKEGGQREAANLRSQGIIFIPKGHAQYPAALLRMADPPRWFFAKGNIEAIHSRGIVAIVGTREASETGQKLAYRFAKELTNRNVIVLSGMAKGIDEQAHRGAVDNYGQTIAVLGHGLNLNQSYSSQELMKGIIEMNGVILSEYMPLERPSRMRYLRRNEIQVALSQCVVPVECPDMKSGTGATVRRAERLKTQVIGIVPASQTNASLSATKNNLQKLGHKVFEVMGQNSTELWRYLKQVVPDHDWSENPQMRQDRFFTVIEQQILKAQKHLSLDDEAIERFVVRLKSKLTNG